MKALFCDKTSIYCKLTLGATVLFSVSVGAISGSGRLVSILFVIVIGALLLMLVRTSASAKLFTMLTIMTAPYFQYRFDLPLVPFHFTAHRLFLIMALTAALLEQTVQRPVSSEYVRNRKQYPSMIAAPSLVLLFIWLLLEILASLRSDFTSGVYRILPRSFAVLTAALIVVVSKDVETIRQLITTFVLSSLIPVTVALWQFAAWAMTGVFPGLPLQSFLAAHLGVFERAYKGAQYKNLPGIGVFPRPSSVMVDPNYLSVFLSTITLIIVGLLICRPRIQQSASMWFSTFIHGSALTILLFANAITLSRSGSLGLVAGLIVLVLLSSQLRQTSALLPKLALIGVFLLPALGIATSRGQDILVPYLARFSRTEFSEGIGGRTPFFRVGLEAFLHNPLFGIGASNMLCMSPYYTAHSTPLTILAEHGAVGFLFFYGGIWATSLSPLLRVSLTKVEIPGLSYLSPIFLGVFTSVLISTLAYDHLFHLESNWVFLGLMMAASNLVITLTRERTRDAEL